MSAPTEAELADMLTQLESIAESLLAIADDVTWAHTRLAKIQTLPLPKTPTENPHG